MPNHIFQQRTQYRRWLFKENLCFLVIYKIGDTVRPIYREQKKTTYLYNTLTAGTVTHLFYETTYFPNRSFRNTSVLFCTAEFIIFHAIRTIPIKNEE